MSLINQMLQDLDARRAAHGVGADLPNDVRPLPPPLASRLPLILGGVVLLVAAAGLALYLWETRSDAAQPPPPAVPVVAAPPPRAPPAPAAEHAVPAEAPPVEPAPAAVGLQELGGSLRLSEFIKPPAEKPRESKPVAASAVAEKAVAAASKAVVEHGQSEAAERPRPPPAEKPVKAPSIERSDPVASTRDRADAEYRKALAAVNQGQLAEAVDGLRNALRIDALHVATRQLLVKLLLEASRPDEAMQVLHEGLQGQPAQLGWAMSLARLQVDRSNLAGAWQTLDYSQPAAGNNADYQGFAAHVLQRLGRNREAAERYQAATRLSPGDGRWWLGLGLALDAEGRSGEAREALLRARQGGNLNAELSALIEQKLR
jgi:MSHA biogenesis protein MshN